MTSSFVPSALAAAMIATACFSLTAHAQNPAVSVAPAQAAATTAHDLSSLRVLQVGGAKLTPEAARRVVASLPVTLQQVFGMAEGLVNYTRLDDPEEIIASVKKGIYAPNFGGGQVDITSGKFVFSASEAYLIENGKITAPIKGATLIGSGPEAMQQVSMVGNDLALDAGVGVCGKQGQSVPVGVGQPTLKLDAMTVGGTQ